MSIRSIHPPPTRTAITGQRVPISGRGPAGAITESQVPYPWVKWMEEIRKIVNDLRNSVNATAGTLNYTTVAYSSSLSFVCLSMAVNFFDVIISGDVTSSAVSNQLPGQIITFSIKQDPVGNHAFAWPTTVKNASPVSPDPNAITVQSFSARADGFLYPIGPATYN